MVSLAVKPKPALDTAVGQGPEGHPNAAVSQPHAATAQHRDTAQPAAASISSADTLPAVESRAEYARESAKTSPTSAEKFLEAPASKPVLTRESAVVPDGAPAHSFGAAASAEAAPAHAPTSDLQRSEVGPPRPASLSSEALRARQDQFEKEILEKAQRNTEGARNTVQSGQRELERIEKQWFVGEARTALQKQVEIDQRTVQERQAHAEALRRTLAESRQLADDAARLSREAHEARSAGNVELAQKKEAEAGQRRELASVQLEGQSAFDSAKTKEHLQRLQETNRALGKAIDHLDTAITVVEYADQGVKIAGVAAGTVLAGPAGAAAVSALYDEAKALGTAGTEYSMGDKSLKEVGQEFLNKQVGIAVDAGLSAGTAYVGGRTGQVIGRMGGNLLTKVAAGAVSGSATNVAGEGVKIGVERAQAAIAFNRAYSSITGPERDATLKVFLRDRGLDGEQITHRLTAAAASGAVTGGVAAGTANWGKVTQIAANDIAGGGTQAAQEYATTGQISVQGVLIGTAAAHLGTRIAQGRAGPGQTTVVEAYTERSVTRAAALDNQTSGDVTHRPDTYRMADYENLRGSTQSPTSPDGPSIQFPRAAQTTTVGTEVIPQRIAVGAEDFDQRIGTPLKLSGGESQGPVGIEVVSAETRSVAPALTMADAGNPGTSPGSSQADSPAAGQLNAAQSGVKQPGSEGSVNSTFGQDPVGASPARTAVPDPFRSLDWFGDVIPGDTKLRLSLKGQELAADPQANFPREIARGPVAKDGKGIRDISRLVEMYDTPGREGEWRKVSTQKINVEEGRIFSLARLTKEAEIGLRPSPEARQAQQGDNLDRIAPNGIPIEFHGYYHPDVGLVEVKPVYHGPDLGRNSG